MMMIVKGRCDTAEQRFAVRVAAAALVNTAANQPKILRAVCSPVNVNDSATRLKIVVGHARKRCGPRDCQTLKNSVNFTQL